MVTVLSASSSQAPKGTCTGLRVLTLTLPGRDCWQAEARVKVNTADGSTTLEAKDKQQEWNVTEVTDSLWSFSSLHPLVLAMHPCLIQCSPLCMLSVQMLSAATQAYTRRLLSQLSQIAQERTGTDLRNHQAQRPAPTADKPAMLHIFTVPNKTNPPQAYVGAGSQGAKGANLPHGRRRCADSRQEEPQRKLRAEC